MANGQITGNEVLSDDVFARLERFAGMLDDIILKFDQAEKKGRSASNSISFADAEKENTEAVNQSKKALSEYERIQRQLEKQEERRVAAQTRLARRLAEQRVETQRLNRETKRNATINNENERVYRRLSLQYAKQKEELKDLVILYGQNSREVRDFAREVEKTGSKIKAADNVAGDFRRNVGNYPSALKPAIGAIKQLVGAFGVIEGIRFTARLIKDLSRIAREAKGIEFAFDRLGSAGVNAFRDVQERTRGLFSDLEIKQAIVEFDNFRLSGEQLGSIFEFIAVRAAQTGQSFEYLRNSAIEAITKESVLRADNLGISQKALNEELEKGVDFLTAFGNVARREIDRAGDILDDASNGAQKFNANLDNIQLGLGQILNTIKGFSLINDIFANYNRQVSATNTVLQSNARAIDKIIAIRGLLFPLAAAQTLKLSEEINKRKELTEKLEEQAKAERKLYEQRVGFIGPQSEENQPSEQNFNFLRGPGLSINQRIGDLNSRIEEYQEKLGKTVETDQSAIKVIREKINALTKERDALTDLFEVQNERNSQQEETLLEGTIKFYQAKIKEQEDLRDSTALTTEEIKKFNEEIERLQFRLQLLQDPDSLKLIIETEGVEGFNNKLGIDVDKMNDDLLRLAEEAQKRADEIKDAFTASAEEIESIYEGVFDTFSRYYNVDLGSFQKLLQGKEVSLDEYASTAKSIGQAITDSTLIRYENELAANSQKLDAILADENSSEEAKAIAQKKYAEQEKRIRIEQAKAQRTATLLQIAIDTAAGIVKAVAASPVTFGMPFSAYVAAIGAAQAALVASQPLPQFFKGKNYTDKYEGPATWGERGREVKIGADGKVEISPNRTTPLFVKKDDIITPSISAFNDKLSQPNSEVFKRVVGNKYYNDTESRMKVVYVNKNNDFDIKAQLEQTNMLLRKYANRPVNVNANLKINKPKRYFSA